jgi:hypothetical protein
MSTKTSQEKKESTERGTKFVVAVLVFFTMALTVQFCWNFLVGELPIQIGKNFLTLPKLEYSHAVVLYLMSNLLFKNKPKIEPSRKETPELTEKDIDKQARMLEILKQKLFN